VREEREGRLPSDPSAEFCDTAITAASCNACLLRCVPQIIEYGHTAPVIALNSNTLYSIIRVPRLLCFNSLPVWSKETIEKLSDQYHFFECAFGSTDSKGRRQGGALLPTIDATLARNRRARHGAP